MSRTTRAALIAGVALALIALPATPASASITNMNCTTNYLGLSYTYATHYFAAAHHVSGTNTVLDDASAASSLAGGYTSTRAWLYGNNGATLYAYAEIGTDPSWTRLPAQFDSRTLWTGGSPYIRFEGRTRNTWGTQTCVKVMYL